MASRRALLLGTAAAVASANLGKTSAWAQQLAGPGAPSLDDAAFLALSRKVTGHANLDAVTASRIFAAMGRTHPDFSARAHQLAELAKNGVDPKALLSAATDAGLRETAMAIVSAWYTGTVGEGSDAVVVSYVDALMYRPVRDGMTVPTYCSNGPLWWTRAIPPAGVAPPAKPG